MDRVLASRPVSIAELERSPSAVRAQAGSEPGSKRTTKPRGKHQA